MPNAFTVDLRGLLGLFCGGGGHLGGLLTVSSDDGRVDGNFVADGAASLLELLERSAKLSVWLPGFKATAAAVSKELLMSSKLDLLTRRLLLSSNEHGSTSVLWTLMEVVLLVVLQVEIDNGTISLSQVFDSVQMTRAGETISLRQSELHDVVSVLVEVGAVGDLD